MRNEVKDTLGVGLIGAGWVGSVRAECFQRLPGIELLAVADSDQDHLGHFADRYEVPARYLDWHELINRDNISVVHIAAPNYLHAEMIMAAANAGKHVICEKPLCLNLEEADSVIETCHRQGVKLCYAERLCFAPKFMQAKQLADAGSIGEIYSVRLSEKCGGPTSAGTWDKAQAGGGALVDIACHGIEFCRWVMDKQPVRSVYAQLNTHRHNNDSGLEDDTIIIMEFEQGRTALVESGWALKGPSQSRAEILGTEGVIHADLVGGIGLQCFTEKEIGRGNEEWPFSGYDWIWERGFPQEIAHFIECIRKDVKPRECGEDGRAVLEIMLAGYHSAATGQKVTLPFRPKGIKQPIDLWHQA